MVYHIVEAAHREPHEPPLSGELTVIVVMPYRGEEHRTFFRPPYLKGGAVVNPQHGIFAEIELVARLQLQLLTRVHHRVTHNHMGKVVTPVFAVYDTIGVGLPELVDEIGAVGVMYRVGGYMIDGIAPISRKWQAPRAFGRLEKHGILDEERLGREVGLDIGTDKHKDAVARSDSHITGNHVRVAVHIQPES